MAYNHDSPPGRSVASKIAALLDGGCDRPDSRSAERPAADAAGTGYRERMSAGGRPRLAAASLVWRRGFADSQGKRGVRWLPSLRGR
jgi:hypothetical protein